MIELYYVEDDADIAETVKTYMERKNYTVTILPDIQKAKEALSLNSPALVLVDLNIPGGSGDELCRYIRSRWSELPVIFLTVKGDSRDIVTGFQNGADDYMTKPFELEVLYSRIIALLRRTGNQSERYLSCGAVSIDQNKMKVFCRDEEIGLSMAEYQLLLLLMQNEGKTVTRERLLECIWDQNGNYVNNNTLTVTMKRLREKLHQPECLKTIRSFGYRIEDTL